MYRLYIANRNYSSWSLRPWVLLKTLGIPFEEELVPFTDGGSWEKFRAFSPTGQVPCLHHGELVVWESLAIVEYLAERHDTVWPQAPEARAWARSAAAEMHGGFSALRNECPMTTSQRIRLHEQSSALAANLDRLSELFGDGFERFGGPFLAGPAFTAVDAFFAPVAFRWRTYALTLSSPASAYLERLLALPAMEFWAEAGRTEPWREPSHAEEIAALGVCLEDLRQDLG